MISIKTNIRLYLPDVLQDTDNILNKLTTISTTVNAGRIYFWTDKDSLDDKKITDFVEKYQSNNIHSLKSIIRPTSFDNQNDFIFFDIKPITNTTVNQYVRFTYNYSKPTQICNGIDKFKEIFDFMKSDKPVIKKQKRNDGEDSNYRE